MEDKYYQPEKGRAAEEMFQALASKKYKVVQKATKKEDCFGHFDYKCKFNNHPLTKWVKVEVKSIKGLTRRHPKQEEWLWVEFNNINGNDGWLYGEANLIAFEMVDHFLLVDRKDLLKFSLETVDLNDRVKLATEAKYKVLTRRERQDKVSLVKTEHVMKNCDYRIWNKH